ncbi:hypothetical protein ACN28S_09865 [Cystobacter fuscus]
MREPFNDIRVESPFLFAVDEVGSAGGVVGLVAGKQRGSPDGGPPTSVGETEAPPPNKESGEAAKPPPPQLQSDVPSFEMGGVVRFNYAYRSWLAPEHPNNRVGNIIFDILALRPRAQYKNLSLKADFHFHSNYAYLRYGYLGYKASDSLDIQAGLMQAPFGILPVPANNWFDNLAFYIGLEDDSDLGVKALFKAGALDVQLAFYKSDEGSFFGRSIDSARYGFDLVRSNDTEVSGVGERTDRETDQGNVRPAYTFRHAESFQTEIGLSGMVGGIYNTQTNGTGWRWAAAAHVHGQYGPLGLQFQALSYAFNPAGPPSRIAGTSSWARSSRPTKWPAGPTCSSRTSATPAAVTRAHQLGGRLQ